MALSRQTSGDITVQYDVNLQYVQNVLLRAYPEWPSPGVTFIDINPLLMDPAARTLVKRHIVSHYDGLNMLSTIDKVAALETQGYLFGMLIADALEVPFVPIRKANTLPGDVVRLPFEASKNWHGRDAMEIQRVSISPGDKLVLVDDVLATGQTCKTASKLLKDLGAVVLEVHCLIELKEYNGRANLPKDVRFWSLFQI